jgi:predicted RNA binding protein YcfA (HicA-like mRNA interferase family)
VPKLPQISGRECVKALEKLGFVQVRHRGSHVVMRCGDRGCSVPMHRTIKVGTLRGVLKQADVDPDDFVMALRG